jgi:cytochrome c553
MGAYLLDNVYLGRNMAGTKPGEIKKLLVIESLPKPINFTGGMDPLSYSGTFTLERALGTVPVEPDGSAYFEAPAMKSIFFVALDANDMAVKRMQSFTTVQPGETLGCTGCHEHRGTARPADARRGPMASRRAPSRIETVAGVPDLIDYPRDVQPVLDTLCVSCHGYEKKPAGRMILTGDRGPMFSHSYYMMTVAKLFSDGRNHPQSNYAPRTLGSGASRIFQKLDGSHHDVKATEQQKKILRVWIDTGAAYPGTYAALGCGSIGGYQQNQPVYLDTDWPTTRDGAEVINRRCGGCHKEPSRLLPRSLSDERGLSFWRPEMNDPRLNTSRHIVFNLTRPEKSKLLLAPLAESAGGWGMCKVFENTNDPDYQKLLAMCVAGRDKLNEMKRFDMPDFRPRRDWVREMKRYGILPPSLDLDKEKLDVYEVERRYWDALWKAGLSVR